MLTLGVAAGDELGKVVVAPPVLAQKHQLRGLGGILRVGDPDIDPDEGLDARRHGRLVELDHGEQVALVSDGAGRHASLPHPFHQRFDAHEAIDQRVFGVQAQMDEGRRHGVRVSAFGQADSRLDFPAGLDSGSRHPH